MALPARTEAASQLGACKPLSANTGSAVASIMLDSAKTVLTATSPRNGRSVSATNAPLADGQPGSWTRGADKQRDRDRGDGETGRRAVGDHQVHALPALRDGGARDQPAGREAGRAGRVGKRVPGVLASPA